jgi:anti-sigma regulatory factor (Ser/Thr protein kinase)
VPLGSKRHEASVTMSHPVADRRSLSGIRRRLRAEMSRLEIDPSLSFDCLVAVTEACTNALVHGMNESDAAHPRLSWEIDRDFARFAVEDFSAHGWSMAAHPSGGLLDMSREQYERRVGGFGLPIMRQLMDDVDIHIGSRGTTVVLTKHFS